MFEELTRHLWQSTLFALAARLLTLAFRGHRAQVRYWLWFSASVKFLLPFWLLMSLGGHIGPRAAVHRIATQIAAPIMVFAAGEVGQVSFVPAAPSAPRTVDWVPLAFSFVWACGFAAIGLMRLQGWRRIRASVKSGVRTELSAGVEVRSCVDVLEPAVVGLFRPMLVLPVGLLENLTPPQLQAVLAHELCHVRRRDNLLASIHMIVEAIFWFHPFVWWIGARLVEERERACDEEVLSQLGEPRIYAEGILNVCKLYIESPLVCVSGVTGGGLKRRIEEIMRNRIGQRLTLANKLMIASAGVAALAIPLIIGISNAPAMQAQSSAAAPVQFDVASIKPNNSGDNHSQVRLAPGGRAWATNATLRSLIATAYSLPDVKLSGGPAWMGTTRFDMDAKGQGKNPDETLAMLQTLLADRFQLKVHREMKELPIYALLVAKNGPKLNPPRGAGCFDPMSLSPGSPPPEPNPGEGPVRPCGGFNIPSPGQMYGAKVPMWRFTMNLTRILGRNVVNKTGLDGPYDITLRWNPNETLSNTEPQSVDNSAPSIFTAVQEQLGLRLESQKGPVEVLIVDRAERPSEN